MDDLIYGDLENFNEVFDVRKVQDENEDLKSRMKKYAIEKQELQKEFDKLTLAFKKLERNYSSLLKTARAEIERKTQMIINLNKEKDQLVLNALQNKNILNTRNSNSNSKKEDSDSSIGKKKKETEDTRISNNFHKNDNQIVTNNSSSKNEINRQPSEDTSSYSSNLTNKSASCDHNQEKYCQSYGDSKENIEQSKSKANSIRNRRKSMPALSEAVPVWSEEEYDEPKQYTNDKDIKYGPDKMAVSASNRFDRIITDPKQMRESRREAAESRNTYSRPYEDRYKNRDGFEATKRYRRWSPEFSRHRRQHGEEHYRQDKYYNSFGRYDNRRRRRLDSSPDNRSRSGDRRYKHEREYNEFETRHQYQDKHAARNKLPSDNDEPPSKRKRTDSPSCQSKEEQRRKEWLPEYANLREKLDEQFMSCQSPDHLFSENPENSASTHIIREIRNTASTRLEDPRTSSKKYSKEIINGQNTLCSVNSKNIELKLIRWHKNDKDNELNKPSLPEMLVNRPENFTDELEKEIFSEVNVEFNRSLESGEISDSETNDVNISGKNAKNKDKKVTDVPKIGKVKTSGDFLLYKIPKKKSCNDKSLQGQKYSIEEKPVRSKHQSSSINENIRHENDTKVSFETHEKSIIVNSKKNNLETNLDISKKSATEEEKLKSLRKSRTKLDKSRTDSKGDNKKIASSNTLETAMNNIEIERENCLETIPLKPNSIKTILAVDEKFLQESLLPVEGICVSQDTNKKTVLFDTEESLKTKISNDKQNCSESNIVNTKQSITALGVEYDFILSDESSDAIEKSKNQDTINNQTETNAQEHTITSSNEVSNTVESNDSMVAKKQSRKMKEKPQTMKIKFKNLFGDSGNLITPEDLGIPLEVQKQQDNITLFKGVVETLKLDKNETSEIKRCDTQSEMFAVSDHNEVKNNIGSIADETKSKSGKKHTEKYDSSKRKRSRKNSDEKVSCKTKTTGIEKKSKNLNTIKEDEEYESKDDVKEIEKNLTENYCNIVLDQSAHIENIKAASAKDSSVVKSVIISTGMQTTSEMTSNVTNLKGDSDNFKHIDSYLRQVTRMEALATSTPVKAFENTVSVSQSNSQTSCDDKSSVSSSIEEDIPDMRVFAFRNRRRKIIKKPPSCPPQTN